MRIAQNSEKNKTNKIMLLWILGLDTKGSLVLKRVQADLLTARKTTRATENAHTRKPGGVYGGCEYSILEGQIALRTLAAVSFARRKQEEEEEMIETFLLTSRSILELRSQI